MHVLSLCLNRSVRGTMQCHLFIFCLALLTKLTQGVSKRLLDDMMRDGEDGKMDDMFDKVGDMLGELVDSLESLKSTCTFTCKSGNYPVPRKGHQPSTNGCGSYGIEFDTGKLPLMTKCCDAHDICYDTCNSDKEKCDKKFKKCLQKMCNTMEYGLSDDEYEGCKATADLIHTGTEMLGCNAYRKAQAKACDCGEENQLPPSDEESETDKLTTTSQNQHKTSKGKQSTQTQSTRKPESQSKQSDKRGKSSRDEL